MAMAEVDFTELDKFSQQMYKAMQEHPKEARKFMNTAGSGLRKVVKGNYNRKTRKHTGNLLKGIKKGKSYRYEPITAYNVRVFNFAKHAHLIELGHELYRRGRGMIKYIEGRHIMDASEKEFTQEFNRLADKYIDKLLEKGFA